MKEGGKPRDEERRKAGKGKEGKKESHEGFDTQVRNISYVALIMLKMPVVYFFIDHPISRDEEGEVKGKEEKE